MMRAEWRWVGEKVLQIANETGRVEYFYLRREREIGTSVRDDESSRQNVGSSLVEFPTNVEPWSLMDG